MWLTINSDGLALKSTGNKWRGEMELRGMEGEFKTWLKDSCEWDGHSDASIVYPEGTTLYTILEVDDTLLDVSTTDEDGVVTKEEPYSVENGEVEYDSVEKDFLFNDALRTARLSQESVYASRKAEYGTLEDQQDMQYHDAIEGTSTWLDHVKAIKSKYPL